MLSGVDVFLVRCQKYIDNYFTAYSSILTLRCLKYDKRTSIFTDLTIWQHQDFDSQNFNNTVIVFVVIPTDTMKLRSGISNEGSSLRR